MKNTLTKLFAENAKKTKEYCYSKAEVNNSMNELMEEVKTIKGNKGFANVSTQELLNDMGAGWNLGNSLDAWDKRTDPSRVPTDYEQLWHNPITTKDMIREIKKKGFNTIRVPVTYRQHLDSNNVIDSAWLDRVEEVINYCLDLDLYVITNVHHDTGKEGVLNAHLDEIETHKAYLKNLWSQIAERFKNHSYKLIFEGFNEILDTRLSDVWAGNEDAFKAVNILNQVFVDTVRAVDGNENRFLACCTYGAQAHENACKDFVMPKDSANDRLIAEVHSYNTKTENIQNLFTTLERYFISKNIPLLIGEFGTKDINKDPDKGYILEDRIKFTTEYVSSARKLGIQCNVWDNNNESYQLFDREDLEWKFPSIAETIIGLTAKISKTSYPYLNGSFDFGDISNYRAGAYSYSTGIFSPYKKTQVSIISYLIPTYNRYSIKINNSAIRVQIFQMDKKMNLVKVDTCATAAEISIEYETRYVGITVYEKNVDHTIESFETLLQTLTIEVIPNSNPIDYYDSTIEENLLQTRKDIRLLKIDQHNHSNKGVLEKFSLGSNNELLFDGNPLEADIDTSNLVTTEQLKNSINNLLDKDTYDPDNDGIIDKAKLLEGMTENGLAQLLKLLELIQSSNPQQYFGTNSENKLGMYYFPINRDGSNSLDQKVILNASKGQIIPIESVTDINQKALVQVYKYIEGEQDIIHTLKEFNNGNSDNFIYSNNVKFNDSCHIKNEYIVHSTLNEITGLYETKLNKGEFIDINKITYEDNSTRTGLQFKNSEGSVFYCDYNGKSYYDKTPIMSSNTTGNYKTSASSYESSAYSPYNAFDNSLSTSWCTKPYQSEGWLSIGNTIEKFKINAIGIYAPYNYSSVNALTEAFRNFKIEGSNDNISWQTIKEIKTGDYEKDVIKIFNLGNIETYNYFRLYEENVDNRKYVCASEIKLLLEVEAPYFLIKDNSTNTIYNYDEENNSLVEVADVSILKESVENNTCIYNLNKVIPLLNNLSDDLTLLCNNNNSVNIQGIKSNKELIVGKQSFSTSIASNIDYFKLDDEASNIKIAFSIDDGLTWKTYNEDTAAFEDMQITIPVDKKYNDFDETDLLNWNNAKETIYNNGIDASALNVIDFNVLDMKRVKFAYVLSASSVDDMSKMKQLIWQFDAHGYVELCSNSDVNIQISSSGIRLKSNIDADMLKVNIAWNSKSDNNAFYF